MDKIVTTAMCIVHVFLMFNQDMSISCQDSSKIKLAHKNKLKLFTLASYTAEKKLGHIPTRIVKAE